jgi:hypothetical protein
LEFKNRLFGIGEVGLIEIEIDNELKYPEMKVININTGIL